MCFVTGVLQTLTWGQQTQTHNKHEHKSKTTIKLARDHLHVFFVYFVSSFANSNSKKQTEDNDKHLMAWFSYPFMTSSFANVFWWQFIKKGTEMVQTQKGDVHILHFTVTTQLAKIIRVHITIWHSSMHFSVMH